MGEQGMQKLYVSRQEWVSRRRSTPSRSPAYKWTRPSRIIRVSSWVARAQKDTDKSCGLLLKDQRKVPELEVPAKGSLRARRLPSL